MNKQGLRQPLLGAAAFAVTVAASLGFCALFSAATLGRGSPFCSSARYPPRWCSRWACTSSTRPF